MFPFLAIFITFCLVLTYNIRKSDAAQQKAEEEFWEKERLANAVRKQDISKLDYITIPLEKIPQKLDTVNEKKIFELADKPMLNLTGISNTDLKLQYGTANINILSEYDTNFTDFVSILPEYTNELMEAGYENAAQELLEFAISCNADSRKIYKQLAELYCTSGRSDKINELMEASNRLPEYTKIAVQKDLSSMN